MSRLQYVSILPSNTRHPNHQRPSRLSHTCCHNHYRSRVSSYTQDKAVFVANITKTSSSSGGVKAVSLFGPDQVKSYVSLDANNQVININKDGNYKFVAIACFGNTTASSQSGALALQYTMDGNTSISPINYVSVDPYGGNDEVPEVSIELHGMKAGDSVMYQWYYTSGQGGVSLADTSLCDGRDNVVGITYMTSQ